MANYTIDTYTADLVSPWEPVGNAILTITPNDGYVVSASDFSIGSDGTSGLTGTFTDDPDPELGPGTPFNTVTCTIDISGLPALSANTTFNIDIEGDAVLYNPADGGGSNEVDTVVNVINCGSNATVVVAAVGGGSVDTLTSHHGKSGQRLTKVGVADDNTGITANSVTKIATITVTASGSNEFLKAPVLKHGYTSRSVAKTEDLLSLDLEGVTATSGKTTVYTFGLNYRASKDFTSVDDITVCVDYETVLAETLANSITKVDYGPDYVSHLGETRKVSVYGKQGATFTYGLENSAGTIIATTETQTIPYAGDFNTGQGVFTFDAAIPASDSSAVTLTVTPVSPTISSATGDQAAISNAIDQKKETDLSFVFTDAAVALGSIVLTPTDLSTTEAANTNIEDLAHKRDTVSSYALQVAVGEASGTPTYTVATTPAWNFDLPSSTNGTTTVTADVTNLVVGMYVYGTGIPAGAYITSLGSGNFVMSAAATAVGTPTLTFSSWSNSVAAYNGGTVVNITNIAGTGAGTTYTLTANVSIERYGNADVIMGLNMNNILKV